MHVLLAPDTFAGTLSAVHAAEAIAEGWRRRAPGDVLELVPMSDGGPGFCTALRASLGGELVPVTVTGPYGGPVPATVLRVGETGYVEAAQACGLQLTPAAERSPERATSRGVGELLLTAVAGGAREVVVGLGGCGTNDGGAGLLAALGARSSPADALGRGPEGLAGLREARLDDALRALSGVRLRAAVDEQTPLLGLTGTTSVHGERRGVREERKQAVDAALERWASATDRALARSKGAGAAGGLGFALLLLGAELEPGVDLVSDVVGLPDRARAADLVVTGEASFDFSSRSGTVPYGVAQVAARALQPCIALAGEVLVGAREMRALGIESAYAVADLVGTDATLSDPAGSLAALAERTARTWSS